ncbi:MAG: glycosyltransferase family 2 protein [Candidatus Omnitrophota bacterium]
MSCDIVIPIWNQFDLTKSCIESIRANTKCGYTVILVDNASGEPVRRYLEELDRDTGVATALIRNERNEGFIKAVNRGIARSSARYVCVLNNDTIVCEGWLGEMISIAEQDASIGIVNPSSNNLGQRPAEGESIEEFARRLESQRGRSSDMAAALGFCMLLKRELIEKVGVFDEVYGMGNFEDTDLSRRSARAGFRCVRACGAYVYHEESSSFGISPNFERDFARNRKIFEARWGAPKRVLYVLGSAGKNDLKKVSDESLSIAGKGNWVHIYARDSVDTNGIPAHSNIIVKKFPDRFFSVRVWLKILTKKKRFHEIRR